MTVHLLGTGSAHAGPNRTTTMLAVEHDTALVLVDCGGDAIQRMQACGLDPATLDALILTHEHPDHISGYPLLVEKLWLMGREEPLPVYGPQATLDKAQALFAVFDTDKWDGVFDRTFHAVPMEKGVTVGHFGGLTVASCPVDHPVPTIGLRFEGGGRVLAYSCDTAFCPDVVSLAEGADVLLHEGTGSLEHVHSSPEEAAQIAAQAGAASLVLVHAPANADDLDLSEARRHAPSVRWGRDGDCVEV